MKNFTLPFIAFLLLQFTSFAQTPDTIWTKTFGGVDYDCGYSVKQTSDGGYIIAAYSKSFSTLIGDLWLIKTNNYGDTLWTKIFAGCAGIGNMSVQQTTDGGYIIVSETAYDDVWLIRTDSLGNTLWIKIFDTGFWDGGRSVVQTEDGGYIIAAYTREPPHLWLLKTDSFGDTVWTKEYQGDGFALQKTYDRGYIVTGLINPGASDIWLLKTDELGNTLWTKTFGGTGIDFGCSVQQTTDGGYIITGNTVIAGGAQIWLIKTDSLGDTVWIRNFGTLDNINRSSDVQQTTDGGYIITGWTNAFGAGSVDVWLIKTDEDGGIIWSKTFGGSSSDGSNSIQLTVDSGYIITGWTSSFGAGNGDVWLIKVDSESVTNIAKNESVLLLDYSLHQNNPNPFNPSTTINWELPEGNNVTLKIFNALGEEVTTLVNEFKPVGKYKTEFNAATLPSGVYFYQLNAGEFISTKKMLLLK
jgi:hypothetical protein